MARGGHALSVRPDEGPSKDEERARLSSLPDDFLQQSASFFVIFESTCPRAVAGSHSPFFLQMRIHTSSSASARSEDAFGHDCPTVLPSPVDEVNREDIDAAFSRQYTSTSTSLSQSSTPVEEQPSSKDAFKCSSSTEREKKARNVPATHFDEKGKGKEIAAASPPSGSSSTKTSSTAIFEGEGTEESPYIVDWTENDPENPLRWVRSFTFRLRRSIEACRFTEVFFLSPSCGRAYGNST